MAARGLGKGLDALIPSAIESDVSKNTSTKSKQEKKEEKKEGETLVNITKVEPNREQPRKNFDEDALEELAESIKQFGLLQPILVQDRKTYYEIIAGERRWRAAKKAGLKEVPVIIKNLTEQEIVEIALIENIQREDLNPIEKARGIKVLMDEYDLTQQKVAEIIGKSRSSVANTVRILNLDERVIELVLKGKLTEGHCKALLSIDDPEKQYQSAVYMIESGDSVREAEKQMRIKKKSSPKVSSRYEAIYRDVEDSFRNFFGSKVKLSAGQRAGKIIIEYSSNEELARLLDLVK